MAMHRLPAGTGAEGPRWRVLAAVWAASAVPAVALLFLVQSFSGWTSAASYAALLWLAVQWALWLYVKDRPAQPRRFDHLGGEPDDSPTIRLAAVEADSPDPGRRAGDHRIGRALDRPGRHALIEWPTATPNPEEYHRMELTELQFTEEEIDHGVKALAGLQLEQEGAVSVHADQVRAVLRAVRAVPARCLNGSLAGIPEPAGTPVQGVGLGGVRVCGWVQWSYPVTTALCTVDGTEAYVWTNTLRSWDPLSTQVRQQVEAIVGPPADQFPYYRSPLLDHLRADDDGMPVEGTR